jgi:formyltetrahydrofolate deformylase
LQVIITALGPDHRGLADPIIHYVTGEGANIAEIQMYDRDAASQFAMMLRIHIEPTALEQLKNSLSKIGSIKGLEVRVWSPDTNISRPRIAICVSHQAEAARSLLENIREEKISATPVMLISNHQNCKTLSDEFDVLWHFIGDPQGRPDEDQFVSLIDSEQIDYIILARYMRVLPPTTCWAFAGGRIMNLHHGLLPGFPGIHPYHAAYRDNMLVYGATCHFIVPELDAGNQIIYQSTFEVAAGSSLEEVIEWGQKKNEPRCLVEGVRRVLEREVQLHFHRVVAKSD